MRRLLCVLSALAALAGAGYALAPPSYVASGGVLLAPRSALVAADATEVSLRSRPGSRMISVQYASSDPLHAAAVVNDFLYRQREALLVDEARVARGGQPLWLYAAFGIALALAVGFFTLPVGRTLRSEKDLNAALGVPIVAARPLAPHALCAQLLAHWFGPGRAVLAVVGAEPGAGRTRVAAELARAFAAMGEPTLLIDADLRAPRLHREFGVPNRGGLADFLAGRRARLAHCGANLALMVAGRSRRDPLELLSARRLPQLLAEAAKRYRVVLVDTPAAARGPDLQVFAAFAGGALIVTKRPARAQALEGLRELLLHARARVVGTVLGRA